MREFLRKLGHALARDAIDDAGAMMAYYAILALFPMLLFVVTLAALVLPASVIDEGTRLAIEAAPSSAKALVQAMVDTITEYARAGFAFGTVAFALWGASRAVSGLMLELDRVFGRVETRPWLRRQGIAIAVTVALAVLLMIALGLLAFGPMLGDVIADRFGLGRVFEVGWAVGRWTAAALLMMVVWALAFRFLPDTDAPLRIFTPGALVGVVLWLGISRLFGLYLDHFSSYRTIYGALGGGVILLTWLWLSSMALLLAAEINAVLAELRTEQATKADS